MDLALEFGIPFEELRERLTERELNEWYRYARKFLLPTQRLGIYLAQLTMWAAKAAPNGIGMGMTVEDFIVPPPAFLDAIEDEEDPAPREVTDLTVGEMHAELGFRPSKKKET